MIYTSCNVRCSSLFRQVGYRYQAQQDFSKSRYHGTLPQQRRTDSAMSFQHQTMSRPRFRTVKIRDEIGGTTTELSKQTFQGRTIKSSVSILAAPHTFCRGWESRYNRASTIGRVLFVPTRSHKAVPRQGGGHMLGLNFFR